jgi:hypothetical protein
MSIGKTIMQQIMAIDYWFLATMGNSGHADRWLIENGLKLKFSQGRGRKAVFVTIVLTSMDDYTITNLNSKEILEGVYFDNLIPCLKSVLERK